jgi:hypothetical protein
MAWSYGGVPFLVYTPSPQPHTPPPPTATCILMELVSKTEIKVDFDPYTSPNTTHRPTPNHFWSFGVQFCKKRGFLGPTPLKFDPTVMYDHLLKCLAMMDGQYWQIKRETYPSWFVKNLFCSKSLWSVEHWSNHWEHFLLEFSSIRQHLKGSKYTANRPYLIWYMIVHMYLYPVIAIAHKQKTAP